MANIRNRAGHGALVRIGGNTQESSTLYTQGTDDGSMIEKIKEEGASVVSLRRSLFYPIDRGRYAPPYMLADRNILEQRG
jgi:hypothetical protein